MPRALAAFGLGLLLSFSAQAAQEDRVTACSKKAAGLEARERDAAFNACLAEYDAKGSPPSPRERMKACTQMAEGKAGEERRLFMTSCLNR